MEQVEDKMDIEVVSSRKSERHYEGIPGPNSFETCDLIPSHPATAGETSGAVEIIIPHQLMQKQYNNKVVFSKN